MDCKGRDTKMSTKFGEMPKKQEVIKMGGIDIFEMKKYQKNYFIEKCNIFTISNYAICSLCFM